MAIDVRDFAGRELSESYYRSDDAIEFVDAVSRWVSMAVFVTLGGHRVVGV